MEHHSKLYLRNLSIWRGFDREQHSRVLSEKIPPVNLKWIKISGLSNN